MKRRNFIVLACALCLVLTAGAIAVAGDDRPEKGKVISIDKDAMSMVVQGEKNDQWNLYWTESTKLEGDLTVQDLAVGDEIHFKYTEKEGKKWLTGLHRTEKAKGKD